MIGLTVPERPREFPTGADLERGRLFLLFVHAIRKICPTGFLQGVILLAIYASQRIE